MKSSSSNPFSDLPVNPYAPPQAASCQAPALLDVNGLWRQGKLLIMHRQAQLPPYCVMSNEPAQEWLSRNLQWHPRWVLVLALINIPIFALVAFLTTKRATINVGLTNEWVSRRKTRMMIAWGAGLLGMLMIAAGIAILISTDGSQPANWQLTMFFALLVLGILMSLGAVIGGSVGCRLIHADRVTDTHLWIKGVHPGFLDRLPVWEG